MIYKYLSEIKHRILFCLIAWSFLIINCYYFKETLLYLFIKLNLTYDFFNSFYFLTTNVTEIFIVYIRLSYFVTNQVITVFICYQIYAFIAKGLYQFEHLYLKIIIKIIFFSWIFFLFILNSIIFPASWNFFLRFQNLLLYQKLTFYFEVKLDEYLNFYQTMYDLCFVLFQLMVLFSLCLDLFKTNLLIIRKIRKVLYFVFFLFATLITPPEVTFQLIISACMIMIYELIILYTILKTTFTNF